LTRKEVAMLYPFVWRHAAAVLGAALLAACRSRPPEFGVSVFADDTVAVAFTVSLTGSLVMGLRAESFKMRPDKSLQMSTPAELIVQSGEGTALIESLDGGRLAVQPLGLHPDSGGTSSAEGRVITLARVGEARTVKLSVEKP
jgi:hypothetical protein